MKKILLAVITLFATVAYPMVLSGQTTSHYRVQTCINNIDSVRFLSETEENLKLMMYYSLPGCYYSAGDIIIEEENTSSVNINIYRSSDFYQCDCYCEHIDSAIIAKDKYKTFNISVFIRNVKGGTEESPIYGDYFIYAKEQINYSPVNIPTTHDLPFQIISEKGLIRIEMESVINGSISIYTIGGQLCKTINISNDNLITIPSDRLNEGVYLLQIKDQTTGKTWIEKVIVK